MNKLLGLIILITGVWSSSAMGHGEERPGPNGGIVRMPGAFHTELVPLSGGKFKVFLLDINFKNPSTKKSSLQVTHTAKADDPANCQIQENLYYLCSLPKDIDPTKKGELRLTSSREGQAGAEVVYPLPFPTSPSAGGHEGHH